MLKASLYKLILFLLARLIAVAGGPRRPFYQKYRAISYPLDFAIHAFAANPPAMRLFGLTTVIRRDEDEVAWGFYNI